MQIALVFPENPSETRIYETELMSRSVDGVHTGYVEAPLVIGIRKWREHTTRGSVYVNRNV